MNVKWIVTRKATLSPGCRGVTQGSRFLKQDYSYLLIIRWLCQCKGSVQEIPAVWKVFMFMFLKITSMFIVSKFAYKRVLKQLKR